MSFNRVMVVAVLAGAAGLAGLAGCQSASQALGMSKVTPDEFRVVTKAPLVVPPDFALRPPAPGEPRPQELAPESAARQALLGAQAASTADEGEKLLTRKAGGDKADPLIRYVVDDEFGDLAHKDPSFAERVMFWRKGKATASGVTMAQAGATAPSPVDAEAEAKRLKQLTGDKPILIQHKDDGGVHIKLPGL